MNHNATQAQALIPQPALCDWIGQTRSGLDKLKKKDPTFPKPIKFSSTRQAAAYYVVTEVEAWLASQIAKRDQAVAA
ncbi:transcriptional regulator [Pseudomonas sp. SA3-5]|uniref:Transcriptional regulator n=1 Tax=Pseudomonas aestuarii TaxID=3018340 RepID=A0ABT4XBC7_9PSED|nr:transcriptional regulator [Pseudomonas aestuarii]MDA7085507.1 transcriptional regulator [Pseudomonas aestuarii]